MHTVGLQGAAGAKVGVTSIVYRVNLTPFVLGRPNPIVVKMYTEYIPHYIMQENTIFWYMNSVHLTTENDLYPARINIDFKHILRRNKFTLYDLHLILPRGLEVDRSKHNDLRAPIVKVSRG